MKFNVHEWIGSWDNFESYIYSESEPMKICWAEAEEAVKAIPSPMFKSGAKGFWQTACSTVTAKNPVRLGGWKITEAENGIHIVWLDETGNSLGEADYAVSDILPKELERCNIVRALHRMPKWEKLP